VCGEEATAVTITSTALSIRWCSTVHGGERNSSEEEAERRWGGPQNEGVEIIKPSKDGGSSHGSTWNHPPATIKTPSSAFICFV